MKLREFRTVASAQVRQKCYLQGFGWGIRLPRKRWYPERSLTNWVAQAKVSGIFFLNEMHIQSLDNRTTYRQKALLNVTSVFCSRRFCDIHSLHELQIEKKLRTTAKSEPGRQWHRLATTAEALIRPTITPKTANGAILGWLSLHFG